MKLTDTKKFFLGLFLHKKFVGLEILFLLIFGIMACSLLEASISSSKTIVTTIQTTKTPPPEKDIDLTAKILETTIGYAKETTAFEAELTATLRADLELAYYTKLTGNRGIVELVYEYAGTLNKDFLFALMWRESQFVPRCKSSNIDIVSGVVLSVDRGLFQLNSKSYPMLTEEDFFQIETNIRYGISHIRSDLDYNKGNARKALWTYNAGRHRVKTEGPPESTQDYADDILKKTQRIKEARESFIKENLSQYVVYLK